jgi:hypothetical protein
MPEIGNQEEARLPAPCTHQLRRYCVRSSAVSSRVTRV